MPRGGRKPARGRGGEGGVGVQAAARAALASDNTRTIPTTYNDTAKRDINPGDTFLCLFSEDSKLRLFPRAHFFFDTQMSPLQPH